MRIYFAILVLALLTTFAFIILAKEDTGIGYAFSSFALKKLFAHENEKIVPVLKKYLILAENQLKSIKSYMKKTSTINRSSITQARFYNEGNENYFKFTEAFKNYIEAFKLLQRLTHGISAMVDDISAIKNYGLASKLLDFKKQLEYPNFRDLVDSQMGIVRLQQIFNISASALSRGNLLGFSTNSGLSPQDLFDLGYYAYRKAYYTLAFDYFDACMSQLKHLDERDNKFEQFVKTMMTEVAEKHDSQLASGMFKTQKNFYHFQHPLGCIDGPNYRNKKRIDATQFLNTFESNVEGKLLLEFGRICKHGDLRHPFQTKNLYCEFSWSNNFIYYLQPHKFEWLSLEPKILRIHNFLSNSEILKLKNNAEPLFARSQVSNSADGQKHNAGRTSSSTSIEDMQPKSKLRYISNRIAAVTGLRVDDTSSENLQVASYSPGAFYAPHFDAYATRDGQAVPDVELTEFLKGKGDRISTFMIYLSDVEVGGATAFPELNFAAQPIKGSAVFWNNLNEDGTLDLNLLHGGCPIVYGSKLIANKWIRSDAQMFHRPCDQVQTVIDKSKFKFFY